MKANKKLFLWTGVCLLIVGIAAFAWWKHHFQNYTPAEVAQDIRAGIASRNAPRPVEQFLELRYGPLTNTANREKAFLDFFNPGHIQGLQVLVSHMGEDQRKTNVAAMAQWLAHYRQTMTPAEKTALGARFRSGSGRSLLQRATGHYLAQDVRYRAQTSQVITELMTTVADVQSQ